MEYVPLLSIQRDLYTLPRGMGRFQEYLRTLFDAEADDLRLPLVSMNPMGKAHLLPFCEALLVMDADGLAAQAVAAFNLSWPNTAAAKLSLVVVDDAMGGWTNRYATELTFLGNAGIYNRPKVWACPWITLPIWTSESYTAEKVQAEVILGLHRASYVLQNGASHSLNQILTQECHAATHSHTQTTQLNLDDLDYTGEVLSPLLTATDTPTLIAALFGDVAARELGYPPLGLSPFAGLAFARSGRFAYFTASTNTSTSNP